MSDDLMTTAQAAEQLGVTPAYVVRLAERAGVALVRIGPNSRGGQWLVPAAVLPQLSAARGKRGRPAHADPSSAAAAQRRSRARRRAP